MTTPDYLYEKAEDNESNVSMLTHQPTSNIDLMSCSSLTQHPKPGLKTTYRTRKPGRERLSEQRPIGQSIQPISGRHGNPNKNHKRALGTIDLALAYSNGDAALHCVVSRRKTRRVYTHQSERNTLREIHEKGKTGIKKMGCAANNANPF